MSGLSVDIMILYRILEIPRVLEIELAASTKDVALQLHLSCQGHEDFEFLGVPLYSYSVKQTHESGGENLPPRAFRVQTFHFHPVLEVPAKETGP